MSQARRIRKTVQAARAAATVATKAGFDVTVFMHSAVPAMLERHGEQGFEARAARSPHLGGWTSGSRPARLRA